MKLFTYTAGDVASHAQLGKDLQAMKAGEYIVQVKRRKPIRSISANAYYWVILNIISMSTGEYDRDRLHEICKRKFNGELIQLPKGGTELIGRSTADLDSKEFAGYVTRVKQWALDEWGIIIPELKDIDYKRWMEITNAYDDNFSG